MRIKNERQQGTLNTYLRAHQRAYVWAEKAIVYRSGAKTELAKAAVGRVNHWLRKIATLEAKAAS